MTPARRALLVLGAALALAGPVVLPAGAQAPRLAKIGALTESWGPTPAFVGLRDGLEELGYRENRHFVIGVRFTQGNVAELPEAALGLVRHGVDVIVTSGDHSARAAQKATGKIPIVFTGVSDPVGAGLAKSLARPGGNVTGIADQEIELVPKRMEILRELVPGLKRLLLVYDATNAVSLGRVQAHRDAAQRLGLTLVERPVRTEDEARAVIGAARKGEVDGIFSPRLLSLNIPGFILESASRRGLPAMFDDPFYVERGGLVSYSAGVYALGRQASRLVAKILKGAKPGDIPIEQPTKFELVINVGAVRALGITIPEAIRVRADRIIE
jgi:putative ABC transport system substrate-binding protein